MSARGAVLVGCALLAGCTSTEPAKWIMYAKFNYLQGLVEGEGKALCAPATKTPELTAFCAGGKEKLTTLATIKAQVEIELAKKEPDWQKIMQYTDLVIGLVAKAAIP